MNKDRIAGSSRQLDGKIRAAIGQAIGDAKLRAEELARQAEGRAQHAAGAANEALADSVKP